MQLHKIHPSCSASHSQWPVKKTTTEGDRKPDWSGKLERKRKVVCSPGREESGLPGANKDGARSLLPEGPFVRSLSHLRGPGDKLTKWPTTGILLSAVLSNRYLATPPQRRDRGAWKRDAIHPPENNAPRAFCVFRPAFRVALDEGHEPLHAFVEKSSVPRSPARKRSPAGTMVRVRSRSRRQPLEIYLNRHPISAFRTMSASSGSLRIGHRRCVTVNGKGRGWRVGDSSRD